MRKTAWAMGSLIVLIVYISCANKPPFSREAAEWDIRETMLRKAMQSINSEYLRSFDYIFLSVKKNREAMDLPPEFMARFKDQIPKAEPVSASEYIDNADGVFHKKDHGRGIIFFVNDITWIDDNTVELEFGNYVASLGARGIYVRVEYINGQWTVTESKGGWVS